MLFKSIALCLCSTVACFADPPVTLDLHSALERAWTYSPALSAATLEANVKTSEERQVGLLPNPVAAVIVDGIDNFAGSNRRKCNREVQYSLSQLIQLGGKRGALQREAAYRTSIALWEVEAVKLDIANTVTKAIVDVKAAQEYVKLAESQQHIAHEMMTSVSSKVQAGKVSPLQARKAEIAHATVKLSLEKARRTLNLAMKKLASAWGMTCPDFTDVDYPLFEIVSLPDLATLTARQCNNPNIAKWDVVIKAAQELVVLEKAEAIPDVVVTAGYVDDHCDGDRWMFGLEVPIPIFDRNQGNICKAQQQLCQLYEKQREDLVQLNLDLTEAYEGLRDAQNHGIAFKESILSAAALAFDSAKEGYQQGKNDYLELLDAQRTLFEAQEQYIKTLVEYHRMKADVLNLVGKYSYENS